MTEVMEDEGLLPRRTFMKLGALGAAAVAAGTAGSVIVPELRRQGFLSKNGVFDAAGVALADLVVYTEVYPTSPLILSPFTDQLNVPQPLKPEKPDIYNSWASRPGYDRAQNSMPGNNAEVHHLPKGKAAADFRAPLVYKLDVTTDAHALTTSDVLAIDKRGRPIASFDKDGKTYAAGTKRKLPDSTVYRFDGGQGLAGPTMINAEYGQPVIVRFNNKLDENPKDLDRQDFGAPDLTFLTHLHNGHTAPESDGNPHYSMNAGPRNHGYDPNTWCDNLYLNWPAGGDEREKQSFFWFHDHRMDHTGANVYKGLHGLYPIYDPVLDSGDERQGLRLPGVRKDLGDGAFAVDYDIPLAVSDCRLDDGVTVHQDIHDTSGEMLPNYPSAAGNPKTRPEWWGKTFFKHFPSHGFVGDIFTVNGTAYPVLEVKRRKYRFRFLDQSVARIYEFKLMSSTKGPRAAVDLGYTNDDLQGQYRIPDGQQCMKFTQIASDGGLLPVPIPRDSFELWPAKRREFIIDFTKYQDGTPTTKGDVVYLTNVMKMTDGRMWTNSSRFAPDAGYKVPVLKFVIGDLPSEPDQSVIPSKMRDLPPLPSNWQSLMSNRLIFEVKRGAGGGEVEWLINGKEFEPGKVATSLKNPAGKALPASQKVGSFNLWEIRNGGGGWVHPFHLHMEEHRTVMRNGKDVTKAGNAANPDDVSREDLISLDPNESVIIYRGFRDFTGKYVAHCHNLAHEDHAMMFGWEITP